MSVHKSRAEKAAGTRDRVVERARVLFLAHGYAATSTRQIAAEAGVTERTLFNIVPSKSELLRQVLLADVFSRDSGPLLSRADFACVSDADSVEDFLRQFCVWATSLHGRSSPLAEMVRSAAVVDPGAAELWAWGNAKQVTDCRALVGLLRDRGWLRAGVPIIGAADSLAVLSGHETYWRLVLNLGWPPQQYSQWLYRHCANELAAVTPNDAEPQ